MSRHRALIAAFVAVALAQPGVVAAAEVHTSIV